MISYIKSMDEEKYYSIQEVADMLKVTYLTVYRWIQAGKLEAYKVEKQYRIALQELQSFMEKRKVNNKNK